MGIVPIGRLVALANHKVHASGELGRVVQPEPVLSVLVISAVEELLGSPIERADLPDLLSRNLWRDFGRQQQVSER